uniref:Uncharacterized protein n=1 Tax=Schistocephalus solidus TaxID=70667 RepID=A0A0X3NHR3_SCHSO
MLTFSMNCYHNCAVISVNVLSPITIITAAAATTTNNNNNTTTVNTTTTTTTAITATTSFRTTTTHTAFVPLLVLYNTSRKCEFYGVFWNVAPEILLLRLQLQLTLPLLVLLLLIHKTVLSLEPFCANL